MRWWLLTGAMLLLVTGVVLLASPEAAWLATATRGYPLALFAATVLLAWRFERSRLAWAALLTPLVWLVLAAFDDPRLIGPLGAAVPLALAFLSLDEDRPLESAGGLTQLILLLGTTGLVVLLIASDIPSLERAFAFVRTVPGDDVWLPVSAPALFAFLAAAALIVAVLAYRRHPAEAGLLLLLPALLGMMAAPDEGVARSAWALAGGAVLTLAAIESAVALAFRDELTGLGSRRSLGTALRALREPYAVAVVDIDHFKSVNDTYGHETGDQVLRMVASHVGRVRDGRAYRSGGEEFTLVFPGLDTIEAYHRVEEVRLSIEQSGFRLRSSDRPKEDATGARKRGNAGASASRAGMLDVTISAGVADERDAEGDPERAVAVADRALYAAKRNGRNRVIAAGIRRVPAA
ncbi:MAG TPA: GGDEF domain-containing protein [Longimicrobiales bacterium]